MSDLTPSPRLNAGRRSVLCMVAVTLCLTGGCTGIGSREAIERTFEYGQVFIPAQATRSGQEVRYRGDILSDRAFVGEQSSKGYREIAGTWLNPVAEQIKPGTRWPVVVFLHGCSGYAFYTKPVAEYYMAMGAIVVAPNSMNRPGRTAMCGSGSMAYRANLRKQEARYAAERLVTLPWVDPARMVLAGQSEGGNAVAAYSGDEFAAHIITGISCRHNGGAVSAPSGTPVLVIKGADDTTYPDGTCSVNRTIGGSRSIVIPDRGHMVLTSEEAKEAIDVFIRDCCGI